MGMCRGLSVLCVLLGVAACERSNGAEYVGDQCTPESLPSGPAGSGFLPQESYLTKAEACDGNPCLVHRLDNRTDGGVLADPNLLCEGATATPGCLTPTKIEQSVYCSCLCAGGDPDKECRCPNGFSCRQLAPLREDGSHDSPRAYCVRPGS